MARQYRFTSVSPEEPRLSIGLMSGTSCDGIGASLIRTSGIGFERRVAFLEYHYEPFEQELREKLFRFYPPSSFDSHSLLQAHLELGERFAVAVERLLAKAGRDAEEVHAVGLHGLTIYHDPPGPHNSGHGGHMEIGEGAIVAQRTGITTVAELRAADIAAGGHGAPLSVYVDYVLFRHPTLSRAIQNIGGIANVTGLPVGCSLAEISSFDTGPGNMVIDGVIRYFAGGRAQYDKDGEMAARGEVNGQLLAELMKHPHVLRKPPKTTGREDFGDQFAAAVIARAGELGLAPEDVVATVTAFSVEAMVFNYRTYLFASKPLDEVVLGGGGTYNKTLVRMLRERVAPAKVMTHEDFGIPNDAREAVTWAIFADEALYGIPANVPNASGAQRKVILGKIIPGHVE